MKHPREVLSRPMIMEHVWDMNADAFSNTLETHVLSLRKKLDIGFKTKLIHTVSGRGYKIDDLK
jgi:two-component system copper resistance phosphate regulon response regulator CusR